MFKKQYIVVILFFLFPIFVNGATLSIDTDLDTIGPNDNFIVTVKVDELITCINTIDAELSFDKDKIKYVDFLSGESIISLWVDSPSNFSAKEINNSGVIKFSGGIPGGYCGKVPGDPGDSNYVAKILFKADQDVHNIGALKTSIEFQKLDVYIHDGLGTLDEVTPIDKTLDIKSTSTETIDSEVLIRTDKISPEPFVVSLFQNSEIFNGRYYIVFHAVDKQTGIDHYEVMEITPEELYGDLQKKSWLERLFLRKKQSAEWKRTIERPYLLSDQSLESIIKVKAVDKAGNERLVEYVPDKKIVVDNEKVVYNLSYILLLILGAVIIAFLIAWLVRQSIKKHN